MTQQKLQAEVNELKAQTRKLESERGFIQENGAFLTAVLTGLAAVGGLSLTLWKQVTEQARQRQADRNQRQAELRQTRLDRQREQEAREQEREQRETESVRYLEERFTGVLSNLGSDSEAVQAGAAVALFTFLRPEQLSFHRQVRMVALANLKVAHSEPVRKILLHVFEDALRLAPLEPNERDLSNAQLNGIDLARVDLSNAELDETQLRHAQLEDVTLREASGKVDLTHARACGSKADLHAVRFGNSEGANANFNAAKLTAAHFEEANLQRATFQRTRLQAAHLELADLRGAQFQQADLRDAYFTDLAGKGRTAQLDERALRSIIRALHWRKAHFSPEHLQRLNELDAERGQLG